MSIAAGEWDENESEVRHPDFAILCEDYCDRDEFHNQTPGSTSMSDTYKYHKASVSNIGCDNWGREEQQGNGDSYRDKLPLRPTRADISCVHYYPDTATSFGPPSSMATGELCSPET